MNTKRVVSFRSSPFSPMADEASATAWAGRTKTLTELRKLCRTWVNLSDSTLDVMWANLGAGKTHALFHLKHLLGSDFQSDGKAGAVFIELPEHVSHFVEIYRLLVPNLPLQLIARLAVKGEPIRLDSRIHRACRAIALGNDGERQLALDWIAAARPGLRELKAITGIDSRIESDADAEHVLADLLKVLAGNEIRVVLLIDEFQRIVRLPQRSREALLAHVRGLFSRTPSYLSLVLAVGSRVEKTALELLPPELRTIIGMKRPISLSEMTVAEAKDFVVQRFAYYRPEGYAGSPEYPFSDETLAFVLSYIAEKTDAHLIPRTILQVLGIVYNELLLDTDQECSRAELVELLDSLRWQDGSQKN